MLRIREEGVDEQAAVTASSATSGKQEHAAAIDRVGDRAAVDRDDEQRHERGVPSRPDEQRRVRLARRAGTGSRPS